MPPLERAAEEVASASWNQVLVIANRLRELERKRSLIEASLLETEQAFQRAHIKGGADTWN